MKERNVVVLVAVAALALLTVRFVEPAFLGGTDGPSGREQAPPAVVQVKRDFMFQVNGFEAEGQTLNMFFHYRYDPGIATDEIPDFRSLRTDAINYMHDNAREGVYWETLSRGVCTLLKNKYPVEAISCQLQIYPGRDPGFSSSTHTIGAIKPLAVPGPLTSGND
ncbi:hypothetical protein GBA63_11800 [Rubrobacter tropicus]|uniref:Uncharacterized protein n=1 Tax=Rubrobacter tropicus TaxID=2653851 RepID=A0A6G8Q9Z6_9ACTN|nr:hypothetical protein [Rubrobacter tropicus]QIN83248.1 hypothetical protein GBA63_11800 [Rubrobacter tropicus]